MLCCAIDPKHSDTFGFAKSVCIVRIHARCVHPLTASPEALADSHGHRMADLGQAVNGEDIRSIMLILVTQRVPEETEALNITERGFGLLTIFVRLFIKRIFG